MSSTTIGRHVTDSVNKTVLYTVPANKIAKWDLLYTANTLGNNKIISVWWYDASRDVEIAIINEYTLSSNSFLQWNGAGSYLQLSEFDEIRVLVSADSDFSVIATLHLEKQILE